MEFTSSITRNSNFKVGRNFSIFGAFRVREISKSRFSNRYIFFSLWSRDGSIYWQSIDMGKKEFINPLFFDLFVLWKQMIRLETSQTTTQTKSNSKKNKSTSSYIRDIFRFFIFHKFDFHLFQNETKYSHSPLCWWAWKKLLKLPPV